MKPYGFFMGFVALTAIANIALSQTPAPVPKSPWEMDILISESRDEFHFNTPSLLASRAGVSTIVKDTNDRLIAAFQWFPESPQSSFDKIAVMFSENDGQTWSNPQTVQFINLPPNITRQFDPTLVAMDDGRIRLYFTGNPDSSQTLNASIGIYSAFSTDGVHYTYEAGERFGVDDAPVIDCSVVSLNGSWHLYSPVQEMIGHAYHATSSDGLNFTRQADIVASTEMNWLGCAVVDGDRIRFFGTAAPKGTLSGVWTALSSDGFTWSEASSFPAGGADPGAVSLSNGKWLITATGNATITGIPSTMWEKY